MATAKHLLVSTVEALRGGGSTSPPGSPTGSVKRESPGLFPSLRKSIQKRSSKMSIWRSGSIPSVTTPSTPYTDEMIRLETVILSPKGRQELIQNLLALEGSQSVKVRFINAVDAYDAAEKEDRQRLGQKIVETFINKGGMFSIPLAQERIDAILGGDMDRLLAARKDVLEDLSLNEEIMDIVGEVEAMDGV